MERLVSAKGEAVIVLYCVWGGEQYHEVVGQDNVGWWCVDYEMETENEEATDLVLEYMAARGHMGTSK